MRIDLITIFPAYFDALDLSLLGKARRSGVLDVVVHDLRDFTNDRHRTVDDTPYGGGPGMLMRPEPWGDALGHVVDAGKDAGSNESDPLLLVPSPAGAPFVQRDAIEWADEPWLVFACGRYEGIDARVTEDAKTRFRVREVSVGDYVLNGGEVAALVIIEAVGRLMPGVVGNADSLADESHAAGALEAPAFTKPPQWRGLDVPDVLFSGNHGKVARWRRAESLRRTAEVRPDLIEAMDPALLDADDLEVLASSGWSVSNGRFQSMAKPVAD